MVDELSYRFLKYRRQYQALFVGTDWESFVQKNAVRDFILTLVQPILWIERILLIPAYFIWRHALPC